MRQIHPDLRRDRATLASAILLVVMGILLLAFFRAQVLRGSTWALQSDSNRLRMVQVPAPRGTIFDRYGRVIAENVPSYTVSLFPDDLESMRGSLDRLGPVLGLDEARVAELKALAEADRRQPLPVLRNAPYEAVAALEERRAEFPGVSVEMQPKRYYQGGAAMGHLLGYVGEISRTELEAPFFEGYEQGMVVGKDGLERQYEERLQGTQGVRYTEVDAAGRALGSFEAQAAIGAVPGQDLHLHIDLGLMEFIHRIFPPDHEGAVVIMNVEDGGLVALYSAPSFDPNHFVGGIDPALWSSLQGDPRRPLFNRAVMGTYAPASTFKLAVAAIALEAGVLLPTEVMPVPCTGSFTFQGQTSACHLATGHGFLDLAGAIAQSCNVYFYQVGIRVGLDILTREGAGLGFGERCGIDLPAESRGTFPPNRGFWLETFGARATEPEVMSLAIGQGPNAQSPLRMAQFYAALGGDGSAPAPRLARLAEGDSVTEPAWSLDLSSASLEALLEGLRQVTDAGGTASASRLEYWDLIGKTGTAQQGGPNGLAHAWFIGLAGPWGARPEVVVAVLVEEGEAGSSVAAPIAAKAVDFYLRRKYGIPVSEVQTYREHLMTGTPAPWINRSPERLRNPTPSTP